MLLLVTWVAIIAISSAVCALVAFVATSQRPLAYVSDASLLIGPPLNGPINESDINVGQLLRVIIEAAVEAWTSARQADDVAMRFATAFE